jgi:hypothetical protein
MKMDKYINPYYQNTVIRNKGKKGKVKSHHGAFQHSGLLYSYPNKFPHSSPEAPCIIQMRKTSTSEGGNYY